MTLTVMDNWCGVKSSNFISGLRRGLKVAFVYIMGLPYNIAQDAKYKTSMQ